MIEVNICNKRQRYLLFDSLESKCILHVGNGNTHDVTPRKMEPINLLNRASDIRSLRECHRLCRDRRITANSNITDKNLFSGNSFNHRRDFISFDLKGRFEHLAL